MKINNGRLASWWCNSNTHHTCQKPWHYYITHTHTYTNSHTIRLSSYRANIPLDIVAHTLAFETSDRCLEWLEPFALTFADAARTQIDCKTSTAIVANI